MNKLKSKILELLQKGSRPEDISLAIALGLTLGTIPILGSTTLLCLGAASSLRLNVPLIMLINYLAYPLQLIFYIPLLLLGARLLDSSVQTLTLPGVYLMLKQDMLGSIQRLFWANLGAVLIWAAIALPIGYLIYSGSQRLMRNFHKTAESHQ